MGTGRRGFSLLEVLFSLAILGVAMTMIGQLVATAARAAARAELQSEATLRCESKLAEVAAGVRPLESVSGSAFEDDPQWQWSIQISPAHIEGLWRVQVAVQHVSGSDLGRIDFRLSRFVYRYEDRRSRSMEPLAGNP